MAAFITAINSTIRITSYNVCYTKLLRIGYDISCMMMLSIFSISPEEFNQGREYFAGCLEKEGYEVLVFHCTGTGGRTMEGLVEAGLISVV